MKRLYVFGFLLFIITIKSLAQTRQVFNLNKLSKNDTLVGGWRFHAGDNPQWSQPGFDDGKWQPVDPGQDINRFSALKNAGIGWIRLHIKVDSSVANQQLAAWVSQYTASEVYLNGRQILKYGTVSADQAKVRAYLPSVEPNYINLNPGDNLVAVRLAYQPNIPHVSYAPLTAFSLDINSYQAALSNYRNYEHDITWFVIFSTLSGGILLIIGFIHLVYFLFDRSQKVNLYYFLFNIILSFYALPNEVWGIERFGPVSAQMWISFADGAAPAVGTLFLLMTIYAIFNYPYRMFFKLLVFVAIVSIVSMYSAGTIGLAMSNEIFPIVSLLAGAYVCIWAIRQQKKDAGFILAGVLLFIALTVITAFLSDSIVFAQGLFDLSLISFPIGMSFYLGVQNSLTNKKLRSMLVEVQTLSAQNLAQEVEKQKFLASQNETLELQVTERTAELNQSLTNLKATQTQLIQSEKMASLGELTAGIAHEIQNPLNFVNNFSEVNTEMLQELKAESEKLKAERDEQLEMELINDLIQNEEKINQHGKRADSIVKGMLEHSRSHSGQKEPTDINAMADEFMRLSYHGLRAKDKSFNAEMGAHFDPELPKIAVVQQDMGRVMLNLFNNAFYAVNQKQKTAGADYRPEVTVTTSVENNQVVIKVKDNGIGIPDAIKDKIMQPFFTTRPTGEGTGLGLSLTYDMVVKGHGGSINVDTKEGSYAEFTVLLPVL
jgi:two-component system NtrC family sensor kinase